MHHGAGTHHTRFQRDVEHRAGEAVVALAGAGITQGADLGVGADILAADGPVPAFANHLLVAHQDSPDGHFAAFGSTPGQGQGLLHPGLVRRLHDGGRTCGIDRSVHGNGAARLPARSRQDPCSGRGMGARWPPTGMANRSTMISAGKPARECLSGSTPSGFRCPATRR